MDSTWMAKGCRGMADYEEPGRAGGGPRPAAPAPATITSDQLDHMHSCTQADAFAMLVQRSRHENANSATIASDLIDTVQRS
ncbi:hypothetical protein ACIRG5_00085 [Lentzea sp. NPDC102401]|uniref:hypothetical protein n=1 Tax=Lentzea sp. NPDC102401 TaxID=3364128 RepID=UPI0038079426